MDQIKRRDAGLAYIADKEVMENPKVLLSILRSIAIMDLISKSERIFMQIIIVRF